MWKRHDVFTKRLGGDYDMREDNTECSQCGSVGTVAGGQALFLPGPLMIQAARFQLVNESAVVILLILARNYNMKTSKILIMNHARLAHQQPHATATATTEEEQK